MKPFIYVCHEIRGASGEQASHEFQKGNIQLAIAKAQVLIDHFPSINFYVPHANVLVNELYFRGYVTGDQILEIEMDMIKGQDCIGVVVIGDYHAGTGVAKEICAASDADKFIHFMEDIMEPDRALFWNALVGWEEE